MARPKTLEGEQRNVSLRLEVPLMDEVAQLSKGTLIPVAALHRAALAYLVAHPAAVLAPVPVRKDWRSVK